VDTTESKERLDKRPRGEDLVSIRGGFYAGACYDGNVESDQLTFLPAAPGAQSCI